MHTLQAENTFFHARSWLIRTSDNIWVFAKLILANFVTQGWQKQRYSPKGRRREQNPNSSNPRHESFNEHCGPSQTRGARIHQASQAGGQHLSSSTGSIDKLQRNATKTEQLSRVWDNRTQKKRYAARSCKPDGSYILASRFLRQFWKVKRDREKQRASFSPAQTTMCVSLTVQAPCHHSSSTLPQFTSIWDKLKCHFKHIQHWGFSVRQ